jgi:phosphoserine aminotransferase
LAILLLSSAPAIVETKKVLGIPDDYLVGIFPGSDTGAFEAAMWSFLGARPVTVLVWESFSEGWAIDVTMESGASFNAYSARSLRGSVRISSSTKGFHSLQDGHFPSHFGD